MPVFGQCAWRCIFVPKYYEGPGPGAAAPGSGEAVLSADDCVQLSALMRSSNAMGEKCECKVLFDSLSKNQLMTTIEVAISSPSTCQRVNNGRVIDGIEEQRQVLPFNTDCHSGSLMCNLNCTDADPMLRRQAIIRSGLKIWNMSSC